jgi:single-stranded DNA-binding protein
MLRINKQAIAGNLAETATIGSVSADRDALNLRVITNEEWTDNNGDKQSKPCGHNVVKFGKKGQFDAFVEKYLQKGMAVYAEGITEKSMNGEFMNVNINATFGGDIQPLQASMRLNTQTIGGNLADDAVIREVSAEREVISFTVITNDSYTKKDGEKVETSCGHDVVQYGKKGQFTALSAMLKKGAGVYLSGTTEKVNRKVEAKDGNEEKTFMNMTVNASFQNIQITKYVTEKPSA